MKESLPRVLIAGEREAGGTCAHCGMAVQLGQGAALCSKCGELHHETCWQLRQHCGGYECAENNAASKDVGPTTLTISHEDLETAVPIPSRSATFAARAGNHDESRARWNKGAIWAFVLSVVGIPLFGLITGLAAILVACIALAGHRHNRRGLGLGVAAILIGLGDVVGWAVGLSYYLDAPPQMVSLQDFAIDVESFDDLPEHLVQAMRANVIVQTSAAVGRDSMGSGVVVSICDKLAYIVTNRHVVDPDYSESTTTVPEDPSSIGRVFISTLDRASLPAKIEWCAPGGIDLAIVSTSVQGDGIRKARWIPDASPKIGDKVFAVGNPHGLGWTHSAGDISQIRVKRQDGYRVRVLQTTAAINPGNSGGGLYDERGQLIGVNTLTGDKRVAEGLGFSIALPTLLDLAPTRFITPDVDTETSTE